jgi:hypothetical protein
MYCPVDARPSSIRSAYFRNCLENAPERSRRREADGSICVHDGEPTQTQLRGRSRKPSPGGLFPSWVVAFFLSTAFV